MKALFCLLRGFTPQLKDVPRAVDAESWLRAETMQDDLHEILKQVAQGPAVRCAARSAVRGWRRWCSVESIPNDTGTARCFSTKPFFWRGSVFLATCPGLSLALFQGISPCRLPWVLGQEGRKKSLQSFRAKRNEDPFLFAKSSHSSHLATGSSL